MVIKNKNGRPILLEMVKAVHENKQYLGDIDGLIGDGDHGMNMMPCFTAPFLSLAAHLCKAAA